MDFLYPNMIKMNCGPANLCGRGKRVPARKEENAVKIGSASSYALIENGDIVRNYRRISKNRKDYEKTCENYREGTDTSSFLFHGVEMTAALCGDLWIYPESFRCSDLLLWPVILIWTKANPANTQSRRQWRAGKRCWLIRCPRSPSAAGEPFSLRTAKSNRASVLIKKGYWS